MQQRERIIRSIPLFSGSLHPARAGRTLQIGKLFFLRHPLEGIDDAFTCTPRSGRGYKRVNTHKVHATSCFALVPNNSGLSLYCCNFAHHESFVAEEVDLVILGGALTQELQAESLVPSLPHKCKVRRSFLPRRQN